jgi:hypothetical protein
VPAVRGRPHQGSLFARAGRSLKRPPRLGLSGSRPGHDCAPQNAKTANATAAKDSAASVKFVVGLAIFCGYAAWLIL